MTKIVSNATFTIAEGKMDEFLSYLNSIKDDLKTWDGLESFAFAKAGEATVLSWAVYRDSVALEANADKFKAAVGGCANLLAAPPGRVVAEMVIEG